MEKVLSQPRVQSEGEEAGQEEAADKNAAMTNQCFEQSAICAANILKPCSNQTESAPAGSCWN